MTRGPKPTPAGIKEAQGNPGKRPLVHDAPSTPEDQAAMAAHDAIAAHGPPGWLDTRDVGTNAANEITTLAMSIWHDLHGQLVRLNILKSTDETTFAMLCRKFAEWVWATRKLDQEGYYYTTSSEHVGELKRPHPALRFRKEAEQTIRHLGEAFGLTPSARQRIFHQLAARAAEQPKLPVGGGAPSEAQAPQPMAPTSPIGILGGGKPH